jgi:hypothetical protein
VDVGLTGHIAGIPEDQFDRLDPAVGMLGCHAKVRQREADGRWRVTYVHGTDSGQLKAAIPLYASRMADWHDPAYDPRAWALPETVSKDCTASSCLMVGSFEERCSGLHVECSAREPGQLRQILVAMAQAAAGQDRHLSFPYFTSAARNALSEAADGHIAWVVLGREANMLDVAQPGWEASLPRRVRYNLRHDRELIAAAGITSGLCSWSEIADTACELVAKHNIEKGYLDHPEFVRARQRRWTGCPEAEIVVFTATSPLVTGLVAGVRWNDELILTELGLTGDEGAARRAVYLDLAFHEPIAFAQSHGLRRIRYGLEAEKVKAGRGAVLHDVHGGVMTASDARRFANDYN